MTIGTGKCSRETPLNSSFSNILPLLTSECKNRIFNRIVVLIAGSWKPVRIVRIFGRKVDIASAFFPDELKSSADSGGFRPYLPVLAAWWRASR